MFSISSRSRICSLWCLTHTSSYKLIVYDQTTSIYAISYVKELCDQFSCRNVSGLYRTKTQPSETYHSTTRRFFFQFCPKHRWWWHKRKIKVILTVTPKLLLLLSSDCLLSSLRRSSYPRLRRLMHDRRNYKEWLRAVASMEVRVWSFPPPVGTCIPSISGRSRIEMVHRDGRECERESRRRNTVGRSVSIPCT